MYSNKAIKLYAATAWVAVGLAVQSVASGGVIFAWGNNQQGQADPPAGEDFVAIAAGQYHNLALRADGSLVGWGHNIYGQIDVPAGNDFVAIAGGAHHSLALRADGSLVGWGNNQFGQGDVPAGNDFVAIAAGGYHSLALGSDGLLVAWGHNNHGQTNVPAGNDFFDIAGGLQHSLALRRDGSLVSWGYGTYGQNSVPVGNDFVAIAAGTNHGLALKADGSLIGWGQNASGQANVPAGHYYVAMAAGAAHSLAILGGGSLVGWGAGNGTGSPHFGQIDVPDGNNFVAVDAGLFHSLALAQEPGPPASLDIRPGTCPNPLNRSSHGYLPVAVAGTGDFDVMGIDVASVRLLRVDGVGGLVAPHEGPPGPRSVFEDTATPFEGEPCDCHGLSGDGIIDLSMKFDTQGVVTILHLNDLNPGDEVELIVTGLLLNGSPFITVGDCVLIVPPSNASPKAEPNGVRTPGARDLSGPSFRHPGMARQRSVTTGKRP